MDQHFEFRIYKPFEGNFKFKVVELVCITGTLDRFRSRFTSTRTPELFRRQVDANGNSSGYRGLGWMAVVEAEGFLACSRIGVTPTTAIDRRVLLPSSPDDAVMSAKDVWCEDWVIVGSFAENYKRAEELLRRENV